jgi:hypothetical protein
LPNLKLVKNLLAKCNCTNYRIKKDSAPIYFVRLRQDRYRDGVLNLHTLLLHPI